MAPVLLALPPDKNYLPDDDVYTTLTSPHLQQTAAFAALYMVVKSFSCFQQSLLLFYYFLKLVD